MLMVLTYRKPRDIPRPGADSSGNPHPDQTAANKAKGVDVYLVMSYTRPGLSADTFKVRRWSAAHGADQQPMSKSLLERRQQVIICTWAVPLWVADEWIGMMACKTTE